MKMAKKNDLSRDDIVVTSSMLSDEDIRLEKLFDEIETSSLGTLENAARQIITLSTALIGAFFGLLAFKDAPTYLGFFEIKLVGAMALTAFLLSLFLALRAVSPRRYEFPQASLTAKRRALNEMLTRKQDSVVWASWTFGTGAFLMLVAALDILIFRI
jgi:hypothetical protein